MDVPSGYFHLSCTFLNRHPSQLRSPTTKMPRASSLQSRRRERRPHPYRRPPQSVTRESNNDQEAGLAADPQDQVAIGQASAEELKQNEKTSLS